MKTINLQHKIQVKIENKISKYAFIRQNMLNKMIFFSNPRQPPIPRNAHPHSFGVYPICPLYGAPIGTLSFCNQNQFCVHKIQFCHNKIIFVLQKWVLLDKIKLCPTKVNFVEQNSILSNKTQFSKVCN